MKLLDGVAAQDFLEIGPGSGDMMACLVQRGIRGTGIEISKKAFEHLCNRFRGRSDVEVLLGDFHKLDSHYDLIIAFEVLEHIDDDMSALRRWHDLLRPGGTILVSVPAHGRAWGQHDILAGHKRRYERGEMIEKLTVAGFGDTVIWSYGFPVTNVLKLLRDMVAGRRLKTDQRSSEERTQESGFYRPIPLRAHRYVFNDLTLYPFYRLQELFFKADWSNGYIVKAYRI